MKKLIAIAVIIMAASMLPGCGASSTNMTDVKMCNFADSESMCGSDISTFSTTDGDIYLSAQLDNVSEGMKVKATWNSLKGELGNSPQEMSSFTAEVPESGSLPFHTYLSPPEKGWPRGDYEVTLALSSDNIQPVNKQFTIK